MHNLVNMVGGNAGFDLARGNIQDFAAQAAGLTHAFLLGLGEDLDLISADKDLEHCLSARVLSLPYFSAIPSMSYCRSHSANIPDQPLLQHSPCPSSELTLLTCSLLGMPLLA